MKPRDQTSRATISPPPTRREILRLGLSCLGGLSLTELARLRAQASLQPSQERTALLVVWLHGGASHLETYDPKPAAASEFRGPFGSIQSAVPGLDLCELLPEHARIARRFTLLRSLVHTGFCHGIGPQQMFTGHEVRDFRPRPDHPDCFSITSQLRRDPTRELPNYVGVGPIPYLGAAYLGPSYEPFAVHGNPNAKDFQVPNIGLTDAAQVQRLGERCSLREKLDHLRRDLDLRGNMLAADEFESQAVKMLTGQQTREAFDLSLEPDHVRDRYGRTQWGQQCLLARRLVESGVDLVTTTLAGPEAGPVQNWDDHAVNHHVFDEMKRRAPIFDQAVSALVEEIYERGLDRRVMVLVTGEFGRTPRISYHEGRPGRDHWPSVTSLLFAGAGIDGAQVIGASDARGERVVERIVGVRDLLATLYRHLGVETAGIEFADFSGRPVPILNGGRCIPELVARG